MSPFSTRAATAPTFARWTTMQRMARSPLSPALVSKCPLLFGLAQLLAKLLCLSGDILYLGEIGVPAITRHNALKTLKRPRERLLFGGHGHCKLVAHLSAHETGVLNTTGDALWPRKRLPEGSMLRVGKVRPELVQHGLLTSHRPQALLQADELGRQRGYVVLQIGDCLDVG
eukprot:scaffold41791_cov29-Tisochrysis_lutea.AAC.4